MTAGFSAALNIDSTNVESLLGLGDAHLAAGKLLARAGNSAIASSHWKQSSEAFMKASKFLAAGTTTSYGPHVPMNLIRALHEVGLR